MTDNMNTMLLDVYSSFIHAIPMDYYSYLFDKEIDFMDDRFYVSYIMLEYIKKIYFENLETHPLNYYKDEVEDASDYDRGQYTRIIQYAQKYKDLNYRLLKEAGVSEKEIKELLGADMSNIEGKLEGHKFNEMDFFERKTMLDLRIIKSYVERRLFSAKKVSNDTFIEYFDEYDNWVKGLIELSKKNDEKMIFASIAFFTFEWKYSLEFIYHLASRMEEEGFSEINPEYLYWLNRHIEKETKLGIKMSHDSRMIYDRLLASYVLFGKDIDEEVADYACDIYTELVCLTTFMEKMPCLVEDKYYYQWIGENTTIEDRASFLRDFNVFDTWQEKEWTNKKIKYARKIMEYLCPFTDEMLKK